MISLTNIKTENIKIQSKKSNLLLQFYGILLVISLISISSVSGNFSNESLAYHEVIKAYKELDSIYEEAKLMSFGVTDCGKHLQLFVISTSGVFDPHRLQNEGKCVLLINNGIHPGEPDGIDASVMFSRQLLADSGYRAAINNVVICIVPIFNIDGSLERGCCSRVNQNGPDEYGFRANAKNLDLNRDFMKIDARNTSSLIKILRLWNPHVTIDTHVSNGADYRHTMTFIAGQHDKLSPVMGKFMKEEFLPALNSKMKMKGDLMCPYVNTVDGIDVPDSGIVAFLESPRYFNGYNALFNTYTFTSETHMLKPFGQRVRATINFLNSTVEFCSEKSSEIVGTRLQAFEADMKRKSYSFNYKCDRSKHEEINFHGYEAGYKKSNVTGRNRLFYDTTKAYIKKIKFYNSFYPEDTVILPKFYVIPQAYEPLVRQLEINGVEMIRVFDDSTTTAVVTYITGFETVKQPYEGHYLHYNVKSRSERQRIKISKGDYLIQLPQKNVRLIVEALNPRAVDSYFCWGFFDSFLQQKEWFSSYVFEDVAEELLNTDAALKSKFEKWKAEQSDPNDFEQLYYIYSHSKYFEKSFRRYPIASIYGE